MKKFMTSKDLKFTPPPKYPTIQDILSGKANESENIKIICVGGGKESKDSAKKSD